MSHKFNDLRFGDLPDIMKTHCFNPKQDHECFVEIAKTLRSHGKFEKYLITLLHTHFKIAHNEILLEFIVRSKRHIVKTPVQKSSLSQGKILPIGWRLFGHSIGYSSDSPCNAIPLEYSTSEIVQDVVPLAEEDYLCFTEIAKVLKYYDNLNRFGVALNYESIELNNGETCLEQTDIHRRILHLRPKPLMEINKGNTIQTSWKLNNKIFAATNCTLESYKYCATYCDGHSYCEKNEDTHIAKFKRGVTVHQEVKKETHYKTEPEEKNKD